MRNDLVCKKMLIEPWLGNGEGREKELDNQIFIMTRTGHEDREF